MCLRTASFWVDKDENIDSMSKKVSPVLVSFSTALCSASFLRMRSKSLLFLDVAFAERVAAGVSGDWRGAVGSCSLFLLKSCLGSFPPDFFPISLWNEANELCQVE